MLEIQKHISSLMGSKTHIKIRNILYRNTSQPMNAPKARLKEKSIAYQMLFFFLSRIKLSEYSSISGQEKGSITNINK